MKTKRTALIVSADQGVKSFLASVLSAEGYEAAVSGNAKTAEKAIALNCPAIIFIDLDIPNAVETVRLMHSLNTCPVLVICMDGRESLRQKAFSVGAVDYIPKPLREDTVVLNRMHAALRTKEKETAGAFTFRTRDLYVDILRRRVTLCKEDIKLSPIEFDILSLFVRREGQVITQEEMMEEIWRNSPPKNAHYVRIYIQRLRDKIGDDPFNPKYIFTEPKLGYRLKSSTGRNDF